MRLMLRDVLPAGTVAADLEVHLDGPAGWAVAPRFNGAVHDVLADGTPSDGLHLTITIEPDAWHPAAPSVIRLMVLLRGGRGGWQGMIDGVARGGAAMLQSDTAPADGTLLLTCQQLLRDGRRDFRDVRCEIPVIAGRIGNGRAITLHEKWTVPVPASLSEATWSGDELIAAVQVGEERFSIQASRRGLLLRGRWCNAHGEGPIWGSLRVDPPARTRRFICPGMVVGAEDLAAARQRIAADPLAASWRLLTDNAGTWLTREAHPHIRPVFIHWNEPGPVRDLKEDCEAAWGNALLASLGCGEAHAAAATRLIAAWAGTNVGIADTGGHLSFSYCLPAMVWAADLLRAEGRLEPGVETSLERWLSEVVRPIARTDLHLNNWRAWAVNLDACIAVFCHRADWFDLALDRHRILAERYTHSPSGITSETGRDLIHAQMGLAPMLATCELAWRQGVDLYADRDHRLRAAVELIGPFAMGHLDDWPLRQPAKDVGRVWPMYELAARHWHGRLGMPMPRTMSVIAATRPEGFDRIGWGTLLHPWEGEAV